MEKYIRRIISLSVYALVFLMPFQLGTFWFPSYTTIFGITIDYLAPALYLTDIVTLIIVILGATYAYRNLQRPAIILFLLLGAINIALALTPAVAAYRFAKILVYYVCLYAVIKKTSFSAKNILILLLAAGIIECILTLMQLSNNQSLQGVWYYLGERAYTSTTPGIAAASLGITKFVRPYGTFSHPNSLGGFYVLLYAFMLTYRPFRSYPLLRFAGIAVVSALIIISFSKGAILAYGAVTLSFIAVEFTRGSRCIFCVLARVGLLIVFAAMAFLTVGDPESIYKRIIVAYHSLIIILTEPLFGVGLGNYLYAEAAFPTRTSYFFLQPVHNIILLLLAELGLLMSLYIIYSLGRYLLNNRRNETIIFMTLAIALTGMVDHYWLTLQQNVILIPILAALAEHGTVRSKRNKTSRSHIA